MRDHLLLRALALAFSVGACRPLADPTAELAVDLTAEKSVGVPEEALNFTVQATGTHLLGVIVRYGDGGVDSVAIPGAKTITARLRHTYLSAGTYTVRAVAEEGSGRSVADSLSMRILSP